MKIITQLCIIVFLLCVETNLLANTIYVDVNAKGIGDGITWVNACTSVSQVITAATAGDEILIATGTYIEREIFIAKKYRRMFG